MGIAIKAMAIYQWQVGCYEATSYEPRIGRKWCFYAKKITLKVYYPKFINVLFGNNMILTGKL